MFNPSHDEKRAASQLLAQLTNPACDKINEFTSHVFRTRGGRIGSGMGLLLEVLWGYYINQLLTSQNAGFELALFPEHQYHDFACVFDSREWNHTTKDGEFFRIEAKSMNLGADESKGHFDVLQDQLDNHDALVVLVWKWEPIDQYHYSPLIADSFFGLAKQVAQLRDSLHIARGGSFVTSDNCPDGCVPSQCPHHGEPLNAARKRERLSGPQSCRPSQTVSYAANYGGLVRMLKTSTSEARNIYRRIRKENDTADAYISFIHRNLPDEEANQYTIGEWRKLADTLGIDAQGLSHDKLITVIRNNHPSYMDKLKDLS